MHELLHRIGRGDARILDMCTRAHRAWIDFFTELHGCDEGTLAARLGFFQPTILRMFDSQALGQAMMGWTAFAALYDIRSGWGAHEARAHELAAAFAASHCSREVKEEARNAAISYGLHQAPAFDDLPANDTREQFALPSWLKARG